MQLAAAGHLISIGAIGFFHAQCYVGFCFLKQAVTDMTAGYIFALLAGKGAVIYIEHHGQSGLVNLDALQCFRVILISNGFTDFCILQAHQGYDVASLSLFHLNTLQALVCIEATNLTRTHLVLVHQSHGFTIMNGTTHNATYYNTADKVIIVQSIYQHLQRCFGINIGSGDIFQNNLEQGLQIIIVILHIQLSNSVAGRCIYYGELQLVLISIQLNEQVQHLVHNLLHALVRTVNLIDNNDGL